MAEWEAIDARLAGYSGAIRVFGFKAECPDQSHSLGAYRVEGQSGLASALKPTFGKYPISHALNWYEETLFVFEYAREAHLFRLRNLEYATEAQA
ncbi:hypothetical protein NOVOSPHI9U_210007 [Novosphingobium sp. 9U]|nr:hypothetical protein NOVOSPHI9U_210007 [Novosphingobium sp. 9U]